MDNFQISAEQRDEINILNGKMLAVGQLMFFLEDGDMMFPNPIDTFNQFGQMIESSAGKINKIVAEIEAAAMEKVKAKRQNEKKEPVTDPETIASFKYSIEKLLESLEPTAREKMVSELAGRKGVAA